MKRNTTIVLICAVLICIGAAFWTARETRLRWKKVSYSQFFAQVEAGEIASVTIVEGSSRLSVANCMRKDGSVESTLLPSDYQDAMKVMRDHSVNIEIQDSSGLAALLINASPFLILLALWIILMRGARNGRFSGWSGT